MPLYPFNDFTLLNFKGLFMQNTHYNVMIVILASAILILLMASFIITIFFLYRKRQLAYYKAIEELRLDYEKSLLRTQLEIQEQTLQHISREIHDNINLSLTLAKLT
jgi:signal transduction histidine kinase